MNLLKSLTRLSAQPKTTKRAAIRAQRGMTLLEIMIVLAIIALVMGIVVGPRLLESSNEAKITTTQLRVKKLAQQSYGFWAQANPTESCPKSWDDMKKYMGTKDTKDPWGQELIMLCGDDAPEAASGGFAVLSTGPDKKRDTKDDIKSWEE